jgi:hypothetical protein
MTYAQQLFTERIQELEYMKQDITLSDCGYNRIVYWNKQNRLERLISINQEWLTKYKR